MSLLVWLPLNGNLENWGSSPAKFSMVNSSGGLKTVTTGKTTANCYQRATANTADYITSDINFTLDGDVTIACWCKITSYGTNNSANGIVTQHGHQTGGLGITMKYVSTSDYRMSINSGLYGDAGGGTNDRTYMTYYGNTNIYNAWHHLCVTYDASTKQARLYVDGKLDRDPVTLAGNNATARPFRLFDWSTDHSSNASYRPPCYLNDVRLYDNCLSAKEVKLLAQGLVAHYKLDAGGNNNLLPGSWNFSGSTGNGAVTQDEEGWYKKSYTHPAGSTSYYDFCQWGNVQTVNANETYTVSFLARSNNATQNFVVYFYNNNSGVQVSNITSSQGHNKGGTDGNCQLTLTSEWKRYWITWKFNGTATPLKKTLLFRILAAGGHVEIAQVKLEKGAKATNYSLGMSETNLGVGDDCSGYGNHGTPYGALALDSNSPRHNCCTVFNGTDTKIELNIKSLMQSVLKDKCTINFWVNETNTGSRSVYFGGFTGSNFNIEMTGGKFRVYWNASPDITTSSITNGVWAMFTVVVDIKTGIKIYKNGVLEYTHSGALTDIASGFTNNTFRIGSDYRTDDTMAECKMSDFRIYCSALSQEDITTLYNTSGSATNQGGLIAYDIFESAGESAKTKKNGLFVAEDFSERGMLGNMKWTTLSDGSSWARIFHHKNHASSVLFTSLNEIMHSDHPDKYSCLYLLDVLKATDGKYEFMLTYPEKHPGQYNRWKQTNNPCKEYVATTSAGTGTAAGYTAVHIDWSASYWGGLTRQNSNETTYTNCYLSGSVGHGNWFYAIGAAAGHDGGIPGPSSGVQETELWVRIDTLPLNTKLSMMKERYVSASLLQEI